jgi:predicted alpha/beta-fold hydrolase
MNNLFSPPFYLKGAFTQTLLASSKLRKKGKSPMLDAAQEVLLNPIGAVKLQGFYSPHPESKGLFMLLHGWEGSVKSAYILHTAKFLYQHGFSIFRLNYRDHGRTQRLNPGLFYAVLLDEVFAAVQQVAAYESEYPFYVAGFSMGGNFALRIARKAAESPISNLKQIFAISPVLDPEKSTCAIDDYLLLQKYFREKWLRSLQIKESLFPDLYDFSDVAELQTITEMTDIMIERYSDYPSASAYFGDYAVLGNALARLTVPLTIITSKDDPIIPIDEFHELKLNALTELVIQPYGGHNGFLESLTGPAWYERKILASIGAL